MTEAQTIAAQRDHIRRLEQAKAGAVPRETAERLERLCNDLSEALDNARAERDTLAGTVAVLERRVSELQTDRAELAQRLRDERAGAEA